MNLEYRRTIHSQKMIIKPDRETEWTSYEWRMISDNEIPGLLACTCEAMNGRVMLTADVTGMKPFTVLLKESAAGNDLFASLVRALLSVFENLERYLLDADGLVLLPETVFADRTSGEIRFLYYPDEKEGASERLKNLAGFLLSKASEEADTIQTAYRFFRLVNEETVSQETLRDFLRKTEGEADPSGIISERIRPDEEDDDFFRKQRSEEDLSAGMETAEIPEIHAGRSLKEGLLSLFGKRRKQTEVQSRDKGRKGKRKEPANNNYSVQNVFKKIIKKPRRQKQAAETEYELFSAVMQEYEPDMKNNVKAEKKKWKSKNDDRKDSRNAQDIRQEKKLQREEEAECSDATVYLGKAGRKEEAFDGAWLVPTEIFAGETIELTQAEHIIGRGRRMGIMDPGSKAVSRKHAGLKRKGGTYAVSDLGSKNGTFVNGRPLGAGEEKLLENGDILKFADAEYHFCLTDKQTEDYTVSDFIRTNKTT